MVALKMFYKPVTFSSDLLRLDSSRSGGIFKLIYYTTDTMYTYNMVQNRATNNPACLLLWRGRKRTQSKKKHQEKHATR